MITETPQVAQTHKIMINTNEVIRLRYRIARYQRMGNGTMCQKLRQQLRALGAE